MIRHMTNNQRQLWNELHGASKVADYSASQTSFAEMAHEHIPPGSRILELGCGVGNDSAFFATNGHQVVATDFSETAIRECQEQRRCPGLAFSTLDISEKLPFDTGAFDVIYARLSLHYFTDAVTRTVFAELARVLRSGGRLCFMCKSTEDRLYGIGTLLEPDMYDENGHIRHFFSESYARELLGNDFTIELLDSTQEELYGKISGAVKVIAVRR